MVLIILLLSCLPKALTSVCAQKMEKMMKSRGKKIKMSALNAVKLKLLISSLEILLLPLPILLYTLHSLCVASFNAIMNDTECDVHFVRISR